MELLNGQVRNLTRRRATRDFVLSQMGSNVGTAPAAVSLALAGMGGAAISTASIDSNEEADYVEFDLEGQRVKGWFWRFPFSGGDELQVSVEDTQASGHRVAFGARRPRDGLVAVYPHCYEGTASHRRSSLRFYGAFALGCWLVLAIIGVGITAFDDGEGRWGPLFEALGFLLLLMFALYGFLGYRATKKLSGFASLAEQVFQAFGWHDPRNINLRKTSRAKRGEKEQADYGYFFFRY